MDKSEPWNSFKIDQNKAGKDLSVLIECFRIVGIVLQPFLPNAANKILNMLNIDISLRMFKNLTNEYAVVSQHILNTPQPIFPRYEK